MAHEKPEGPYPGESPCSRSDSHYEQYGPGLEGTANVCRRYGLKVAAGARWLAASFLTWKKAT
jgi:hypothetical protein